MKVPEYVLNNGRKIPAVGFGTYNPQGTDIYRNILDAMEAGYRFFDTASLYETERSLGKAVKDCGIPREQLFIETKLWYDERGYEGAMKAVDASLKRLQMDYLDSFMIHWPRATGEWDENWAEVDLDTWRAMEDMVKAGKVLSLGVSNFLPMHLETLAKEMTILPAVAQLELHPGYSQEAAVAYLKEKGIRPMGWSPLSRGNSMPELTGKILSHLAEKYGRSTSQISMRFLVQKGIIPIPKTASPAHMKENLDVMDFTLAEEDMWMISCMPQIGWLGEHPDFAIPVKDSNPDQ